MRPSAIDRSDSWTRSSCGSNPSAVSVQLGISVQLGHIPADPALELIFEQSHEARRPAAEGEDRLWRPCRLGTDRDRGRARGFGHEQERITSRQPAERAKLVAGDEDQPSRDAAAAKIFEHPVRRVCLVREADLDVLRVTRHLRVGQACGPRRDLAELDRFLQAVQARSTQPAFDRLEELCDLRFRWIGPLGLRDEIDFPPG